VPEQPTARVIADSTYADGPRVTTMEVSFHRFVLAEFNTHRVFSRNSASSRAIPIHKQIAKLVDGIAAPLAWPAEKPGMQGGDELDDATAAEASSVWSGIAEQTVAVAERLRGLGVHKSVVNRILEPYMWHTVVVTSTAWTNFFAQRSNVLAQPEIRRVSELMQEAYDASQPVELTEGGWHLPYVQPDELGVGTDWAELARISAARCARTSYLTQNGVRDHAKDLELYQRLVTARPAHWSPLEHVATPWPENAAAGSLSFTDVEDKPQVVHLDHLPRVGNLLGWRSLRTEVEAAQGSATFA
jgi:thymidylate synthase ThyX